MNRVLGHCLAGLAVLTGAISLTSACAHDDSSLFVQNVIFPQPQGAGTECTYTANPSQLFLSVGTLDTAFRNDYEAVFLLANQLVAVAGQSNSTEVMTETNDINIQGAIVRVTDAAGNQLDSFTSLTSGTVYASVGGTPGYAVASATAISSKALAAAGTPANGGTVTLVSYLKFFGHTLGGDYIESNEFEFPVDVCNNCLVTYSQGDISSCYAGPNCECAASMSTPGCSSTTASSAQTVPCRIGQDTTFDCSQCVGDPACRPNRNNFVGGPGCTADAGAGGG
jgi:hypothetical protein